MPIRCFLLLDINLMAWEQLLKTILVNEMTAKRIFLLLCAFVAILSLLNISNEAKRKKASRYFIRIVQLADCPGQYSTSLVNITQMSYTGGAISGLFIVNDDHLPPKLMVFFDVTKCKTLDDPSCEPYVSGMLDWCKFIVDKGQFYSPLFQSFHPPLRCPMKKGTFEIINGTYSYEAMVNLLKVIPQEYHQVFWKSKLTLTPPGRPEKIKSCFNVVFKYYPKRNR